MAFIRPTTDAYGDEFPEAYWHVYQVHANRVTRQAVATFYAYESKEKKGKRVIGERSYSACGDDFSEYFGPTDLSPEGRNPWEAAYRLALATEDDGPADARRSFFADAEHA